MGGVVPLLPCVRACVPACLGAPIPPARRAALTLAPLPPLPMRAPPLDPPDWNPQVRAVDACACRGTLVGCVQWRQHATAPECPCCAQHPERLPPPPLPIFLCRTTCRPCLGPTASARRTLSTSTGERWRMGGEALAARASSAAWPSRPPPLPARTARPHTAPEPLGACAPPPSPRPPCAQVCHLWQRGGGHP